MEEVKDLVFNAPTPDTPGYAIRMEAALNFQITYNELSIEMERVKEIKDDKLAQIEASKKMRSFFNDLIDFMTGYVVADSPEKARELLRMCSQNQLMGLMSSLQGGGEKELPPQTGEREISQENTA